MGRSNGPSFFKILIHDFSQELCLPADYIKNFNGEVPKRFILTNSTRRSWVVSVKKVDNDLLLSEEWPNFAKDNALEFGDLLVFINNDNSEFGVKIFGSNACEKEVDLSMKNNAESNSNLKEEQEGKDMGNSDKLHSRFRHKYFRRTVEAAVTDKTISFPNSMPIKTERTEVLEVGLSFTATFHPSRKYKIGIPNEIVKEKGLAEKDKMVLLDPCGRSWPVTIYCWKKGRTTLTGGWSDFCTANKLKTNDTCHFQFIEGMDDAIKVEIFRTRLKGPTAKPASAGTKTSTDISKKVIKAPTRKRPREFVYDRVLHNSKQERCPKFELHVKESDKGEPRRKQHDPLTNRLIAAQEKHRIIAAAAFTSNNPFCYVIMQASYVGKNFALVLPNAFAKKYMKHAPRGVTLRDSNDGTWHAQYRVGAQHKFIMGWKAFVFDNHLKECDVCIFELVDESPKHYVLKVTIIRH